LSVLSSWANADPVAASAWAAQFPESDLRQNALRNLMSNWAQNDPVGAGQFLAGLAGGKSRDSAAQSYVSQLSWQSPELAAPFVNFIADDNQRYSSAMNVARGYLRNDPVGAEKWIAGLTLTEDKKAQLLKMK